ncbi:MAG: transcription elongation factor GreA [Bacteroidetes bacterium]|nr:MAG: transcription elongation factor GreA [Bacteroidota bacterium]
MSGVNYFSQEDYDSLLSALEAAKEAREKLGIQIKTLEALLDNSSVLDKSKMDDSKVSVLSEVTIKNTETEEELTYKLVFDNEADLRNQKISVTSTLGTNLVGSEVGDVVNVKTPRGNLGFEILSIKN